MPADEPFVPDVIRRPRIRARWGTAHTGEFVAAAPRGEPWMANPVRRECLTTATIQLMQLEVEAAEVRYFGPTLLPGPIQTRPYADAVFRLLHPGLGDAVARARIDARMSRHRRIFQGPEPPRYLVLLDESVLYRQVGGATVMGGQLQALASMIKLYDNLAVRVLPYAAIAPIAALGPFLVLDLRDGDRVLYRELPLRDEILHDTVEAWRHRELFERFWSLALDESESACRIRDRLDALSRLAPDGREPGG
jgi:hypothetical protein